MGRENYSESLRVIRGDFFVYRCGLTLGIASADGMEKVSVGVSLETFVYGTKSN